MEIFRSWGYPCRTIRFTLGKPHHFSRMLQEHHPSCDWRIHITLENGSSRYFDVLISIRPRRNSPLMLSHIHVASSRYTSLWSTPTSAIGPDANGSVQFSRVLNVFERKFILTVQRIRDQGLQERKRNASGRREGYRGYGCCRHPSFGSAWWTHQQ